MEEFSHTQEALAQAVGKSRSHVANMMRLLALPEPVKRLVETGELTAGHARALLNAADPVALAREIVKRGLNVRQAESLAKTGKKPGKAAAAPAKDADTAALERDLAEQLGLKVAVNFGERGGSLTMHSSTMCCGVCSRRRRRGRIKTDDY
jgi:ParB family chromosome partitioning protein